MKKPIKTLILTHNYPRYPGDYSGVFISLLARRLREFDIEPIILAPHDEGSPEYAENDGVKIHRFRYAKDVKQETIAYRGTMQHEVMGSISGLWRFRQFLKCFEKKALEIIDSEQIDVLAGHWLLPTGIVMKRLQKSFKGPMVLSSHGTDVRLMSAMGGMPYRYLRQFCRGLDRWTVVSEWLKQQILKSDSTLDDILKVLPLPHDETVFFPDPEITREKQLVVAVTRFTLQKRVKNLIKAFARLSITVPDARLEIYGTGPLQNSIEQEIAAQGLSHMVIIHEPVPQTELRKIYSRASVVVLNSYQEGFGLALSEAMLCGAAVVGTESGGITDIIEHGCRGLLVKPDDINDLADGVTRLLTDNVYRAKLAAAGTEYAKKTYASGPLAERYASILRDCYKKKKV